MQTILPEPVQTAGTQTRAPWLLLFNCQAMGLGNCLNLLCNKIDVEYHDAVSYLQNLKAIHARLDAYERILIAPRIESSLRFDVDAWRNVWRVPHIWFPAYHPDLCHLAATGNLSQGPLANSHSVIAFSAFRCGLTVREAAGLYGEATYDKLGYFDQWDPACSQLLAQFSQCGFDIRQCLTSWSRNGPFMHTINHPRIHVLRDVAALILRRAGHEINETALVPHDNLAAGPSFPVYPEIGTRLGVRGSHFFKQGGKKYRLMCLEEFVARSYAHYEACSDLNPTIPAFLPLLTLAMSVIKASR